MSAHEPACVVILPVTAETPAARLVIAADGAVISRDLLHAGDPPAAMDTPAQRVVVVVPGTAAPARWLQLSAYTPAQARGAARAQVTEELAAGDTIHVAVGTTPDPHTPCPVVTVSDQAMQGWLAQVAALGLYPDVLVPDHLLLPLPDDSAPPVVVACAGDWLVRTGTRSFRLEADLAAAVLGEATPLNVPGGDSVEALLARGAREAPVNLLQGAYAPATATPTGPRAWRRTAVLASLLLASIPLIWAAETVHHLFSAQRETSLTSQAIEAALPGATAGGNPVEIVRTALSHARARDAFPHAFSTLAAGIRELDGVALERISWQAGAPLQASVMHRTPHQLDALASAAARRGLQLAPLETRPAGDGLSSSVELMEAQP